VARGGSCAEEGLEVVLVVSVLLLLMDAAAERRNRQRFFGPGALEGGLSKVGIEADVLLLLGTIQDEV